MIAFDAYMVLLSRASAAVAAGYTLVNPVIAMLLGVWLANKQVTPFEAISAGVILRGVLLLWRRSTTA
ncbi:EamA family transporter [Rhizobacter sp. Root404]|uniref:EamA family transporter n=1 Tax=Rhizobacter sp. Root404 TaxID=1736528 RepID=UPI0021102657|nr:EamA family transporter [Rhizobacter sp. Root404]